MATIQLTKKQQEAVDYDGQHLLIRGIAGSGKTTVLLQKAYAILTKHPNETVALFTFNSTLAAYAEELARVINSDRLKVHTFHSWAGRVLSQMKINFHVVDDEESELKIAIDELKKKSVHRFFREEVYIKFLSDEITWMKGSGLIDRNRYLGAERIGRGNKVRVDRQDRDSIFDLFEQYQRNLKKKNKCDYDDYGLLLREHFDKFPVTARIDNVLIDEAQDLHQEQLRILKDTAQKRLVIAADKGQKIYKTSFSWRALDINVSGGRTKILDNSFRSTKQIIALAASLQQHDPICRNKDDEFVTPVLPEREGPVPTIYRLGNYMEEEEHVVGLVKEFLKEHPKLIIGILSREKKSLFRFHGRLQSERILCDIIQRGKGSITSPGVKLMTFHSAKGLEFDAVILIRIREHTVPLLFRNDKELDEEELAIERRLLYVSMTRAKSALFMTYYDKPSRFIAEMDASLYQLQ